MDAENDDHGPEHGHGHNLGHDQQTGAAAPAGELSARDSLALIDNGLRRTRRRVHTAPALLFTVWGAAWLVGFGAAYLAHGPDRVLPAPVGVAVPAVLLVSALAWSIAYSLKTDRGLSGPSRTVGAMYGWSWTLGFVCLFVINNTLIRRGLSSDEAALLWSASALLLTGVLFLAGGMIWQDRFQYVLGVWTMACATGAVFAGVPGNFLVQSLAGGGGFLALAAYHRLTEGAATT